MAKNFDAINTERQEIGTETGEVFTTIERGKNGSGQQGTASREEQEARAAEGRTQGRKGCRMQRINTAFTTENLDFVRVMAAIRGETMTKFINYCIEQYREEHPEMYEAAKAVTEMAERPPEAEI